LRECARVEQLPEGGAVPIGILARGLIRGIYLQFVKKSKKLPQHAPAKELYELHQMSKQLGYHMDVFGSLFPEKKIKKMLKSQAKLQSSLNQFRDMNLQYSRLREYKSGMKRAQAVRKASLEAVEQLIADRKSEKAKAHKKAIKQIKRFTRRKMRKRFKSILSSPAEGST
jgi:hypothetical protein